MSEFVFIKANILLNPDDIKDIKGLELQGLDEEIYIVRLFQKVPYVDIACKDLKTAKETYKNLMKTRRIIDINEMRYGK